MKPGTRVENIHNPGVVGRVIPTGTRKDGSPGQFKKYINVIWPDGRTYHHLKRFLVEAVENA